MSVRIRFTAIRANARIKPVGEIRRRLEDFSQDFLEDVVRVTKQYPPVPPNSRYTRTYRLFRYWKVRPVLNHAGIQYEIINPVQDKRSIYYSGYVHGPSRQWHVHAAHGWRNIKDVVALFEGGRRSFNRGVQHILNDIVERV